MLERFCIAPYLPDGALRGGSVFALVEVENGGGTVFRNGVSAEVAAPCCWVAAPNEIYAFHGSDEWQLRVVVMDGRVLENIYVDLPGDAALSLWRQIVGAGHMFSSACEEFAELHRLQDELTALLPTQEGAFLAISCLWQLTATLYRAVGREEKLLNGSVRVSQPPRRLLGTLRFMQENYATKIALADLAKTANMSVSNFSAVFRRAFGMPPMEYLLQIRLRHATYLLHHTDEKIITVAEECGFFSNSNFIKAFTRATGMTPSEYRKHCGTQRSGRSGS